jgi:hypothetical protein
MERRPTIYVVRIALYPDQVNNRDLQELLGGLATARLITLRMGEPVRDTASVDLYAPPDANSAEWASMTAESLTLRGFNAVRAPYVPQEAPSWVGMGDALERLASAVERIATVVDAFKKVAALCDRAGLLVRLVRG